jgi:hypothetical protein
VHWPGRARHARRRWPCRRSGPHLRRLWSVAAGLQEEGTCAAVCCCCVRALQPARSRAPAVQGQAFFRLNTSLNEKVEHLHVEGSDVSSRGGVSRRRCAPTDTRAGAQIWTASQYSLNLFENDGQDEAIFLMVPGTCIPRPPSAACPAPNLPPGAGADKINDLCVTHAFGGSKGCLLACQDRYIRVVKVPVPRCLPAARYPTTRGAGQGDLRGDRRGRARDGRAGVAGCGPIACSPTRSDARTAAPGAEAKGTRYASHPHLASVAQPGAHSRAAGSSTARILPSAACRWWTTAPRSCGRCRKRSSVARAHRTGPPTLMMRLAGWSAVPAVCPACGWQRCCRAIGRTSSWAATAGGPAARRAAPRRAAARSLEREGWWRSTH